MSTFFYMLLAFVVGVLVGWFAWGRLRGELDSLRGDLDRARSERDRFRADSDRLTGELDACGRARADLERRLNEAQPAPVALISTPAAAESPAAKPASAKPAVGAKPAAARSVAAAKPAARSSAPKKAAPASRRTSAAGTAPGKADNLRRLIGIGPVNERLLKGQGVTTYAQIAAWTEADVKRVEEVLNFDGRIAREKWIEQARLLAASDEKEFARRFPTAGTASNT